MHKSSYVIRDQINFHLSTECKNLLGTQAHYYSFHINVNSGMGGELDTERLDAKYHYKVVNRTVPHILKFTKAFLLILDCEERGIQRSSK